MRVPLLLAAAVLAACAPGRAQVVQGRVLAAGADSCAVPAARVRLLPSGAGAAPVETRTDSTGGFALRAPIRGTYRLAAARVGFRDAVSAELTLGDGDTLDVRFRLSPDTVLLEPLTVLGTSRRRPPAIRDFYRRAESEGFGWFLTRAGIEQRAPVRTTDVLLGAPGLRVLPGRSGGVIQGRGGCVPAVFLDGLRIGPGTIDQWTMPRELEGIEVYSTGGAPPEFGGRGAGCAVVLLWTRY